MFVKKNIQKIYVIHFHIQHILSWSWNKVIFYSMCLIKKMTQFYSTIKGIFIIYPPLSLFLIVSIQKQLWPFSPLRILAKASLVSFINITLLKKLSWLHCIRFWTKMSGWYGNMATVKKCTVKFLIKYLWVCFQERVLYSRNT